MRIAVLVVFLAACGGAGSKAATSGSRAGTGSIIGLARDHDSGDPVAKADIRVRATGQLKPIITLSSDSGTYEIPKLRPGRYTLSALFAGQPVEVSNIDVRAGEATTVDVTFTLGRPEKIEIDHEKHAGEIDRYRPKTLPTSIALIEGTVNDLSTRLRVPGAVVTAVQGNDIASTQQTVSDDSGRYRFDAMRPGTYSISAYYSVPGRAQIEVRRSGIEVDGAEAVVVPLWIEMQR